MKNQRGAALIVVLVLLTVSLMLGLSGMQSALIDERLAGNYKAATEAKMNAERGAAEFYSWLIEKVESDAKWPVEDDWKEAVKNNKYNFYEDVNGGLYAIHNEDGDLEAPSWKTSSVSLVIKGFSPSPAEAELFLKFKYESPFDIHAALTCYGTNCSVSPGSGQASNSFNGHDHEIDEVAGCSIKGSNTPELNPMGFSKAGVIVPEGMLTSGAESNVEGDPAVINSVDGYEEVFGGSLIKAQELFNAQFGGVIEGVEPSSAKISGMNNMVYAGPGQTIEVDDNAGGVIVLEGGTLEMKGNSCFAGLVLARESSSDGGESRIIMPEFDARGTSAIVGGVVGQAIQFSGSGTPSVYYSSKAISTFAGRYLNHGVRPVLWSNE